MGKYICLFFLFIVFDLLVLVAGENLESSFNISIKILRPLVFIGGGVHLVFSFFWGFNAPFYFFPDRVERKRLWGKKICCWDSVIKCEKVRKRMRGFDMYFLMLTTDNLKKFKIPLEGYSVYDIILEMCPNKNIIDIMDDGIYY